MCPLLYLILLLWPQFSWIFPYVAYTYIYNNKFCNYYWKAIVIIDVRKYNETKMFVNMFCWFMSATFHFTVILNVKNAAIGLDFNCRGKKELTWYPEKVICWRVGHHIISPFLNDWPVLSNMICFQQPNHLVTKSISGDTSIKCLQIAVQEGKNTRNGSTIP